MRVRAFQREDLAAAISIWNTVVEDGLAFPQTEPLDEAGGLTFFLEQSHTGIADGGSGPAGLYILHPNNVGRCGHIANASYAVARDQRGRGIGELLVRDSLWRAKALGFRIMQFNAVVASNGRALRLYEKLGFVRLGVIPGGFLMKDGTYQDIVPHYKVL
ncbi:GNAT family N-acetyltransferase [Gehongia tenuis]|uniref:GNAT family N-acetyltransferase n=1 Tax=Gehongia tenuis TaxID=2763655 RepID=A0A926D3A9_9FIRM|nr:GNAT family N-acetyltransferase [Gehongia tenuis]MBC8530518.1 GNAT family N-acetyltransferase [Gehongia tenuis]